MDGQIQLGHIDLLAADVKVHAVVLNEQGDVLPVSVVQLRILDGDELLVGGGGVHHIQSVGLSVGDDLKNGPGPVILLKGQKAAPVSLRLLEVGQEDEALLGLDGVEDVPEGAVGDWGDQVCVQDLVGKSVRIFPSDQAHSVLPPAYPGQLK